MALGTSNGKAEGTAWNAVSAFQTSDNKIEFHLAFHDEDERHRIVDGKVDTLVFVIDDDDALLSMIEIAAQAITAMRRRRHIHEQLERQLRPKTLKK